MTWKILNLPSVSKALILSKETKLCWYDAAAREESFQTRSGAANRPLRNKKKFPPKTKYRIQQHSLVTFLGAVAMACGDRVWE